MSKLTLSVDESVIVRAKRYAKSRGASVSQLVEAYLDLLSAPPKSRAKTPVLRALRGTLKQAPVAEYKRYLKQKYR